MEQTSAKREKRKSLLRIAIPIILSSCLQISYDITDMFWVGKLGSGEVAAVGIAGFYIKLGWSLISVITIGTMVSVSHSIGAEKKDRIQHFISCGIRSTFVLGIFYALFVFMLAEPLISLFNIERPEVNTMAQNYLRISSITVLIMFMNLLFTAIKTHTERHSSRSGRYFMGISSISFLTLCLYFISDWEWKVRHGLRHFHSGVP